MKLKTHKGAAKRIKKSGKRTFAFQKAAKRHLLIHKSKRQKKLDRTRIAVHSTDVLKLTRLLPN